MSKLVLASTSRYRKQLLERLDVPFEVDAPSFDERAHEALFAERSDDAFAVELARGKAVSLQAKHPDAWILAADQIAVTENPRRLLHKPGSKAKAIDQLMGLAGGRHTLTTGLVLLETATGRCMQAHDRQTLTMRAYSRDEASAYVEAYEPTDSVGSYRIEDAGIRLVEAIDGGDFTGIMGLPLLAVCKLLRQAGLLPGAGPSYSSGHP